ncbi:polysaccharide pyruvyl transferase family protein [Rhodococcus sovatensis]|uniref:Polysaccharide pyruvyl transferase family protein n=1 Tax=Rhodococcus sovatensis TaxID=1805840 RepID=A0ABZ2PJR6_9NOCA
MSSEQLILVVGWSSFVHGESTAGDVLATEAVRRHLCENALFHDVAWSPVMASAIPPATFPNVISRNVIYDEVVPASYTHVIFVCGPVHGDQIAEMHRVFAHCRRIALGVSVIDPLAPEVRDFHTVIARDQISSVPSIDVSATVPTEDLPLVGVMLTSGQNEYGHRRRHESVISTLDQWLTGRDEYAFVELDTRLDPRGWRSTSSADQVETLIRKCAAVITMRMHGLVLALKNAVPVVGIDPVSGGGKLTDQATAWSWPAVIACTEVSDGALDRNIQWALSERGRWHALEASLLAGPPSDQFLRLDAALQISP